MSGYILSHNRSITNCSISADIPFTNQLTNTSNNSSKNNVYITQFRPILPDKSSALLSQPSTSQILKLPSNNAINRINDPSKAMVISPEPITVNSLMQNFGTSWHTKRSSLKKMDQELSNTVDLVNDEEMARKKVPYSKISYNTNNHSLIEPLPNSSATSKTKINDEIKSRNNKFMNELFEKSLTSINRIYKEHTASIAYMSFNNTMSDRIEEFYLNQSNKSELYSNKKEKRDMHHIPLKSRKLRSASFTCKELNKLNRLNDLMSIYSCSDRSSQKSLQNIVTTSSRYTMTEENMNEQADIGIESPTLEEEKASDEKIHEETTREDDHNDHNDHNDLDTADYNSKQNLSNCSDMQVQENSPEKGVKNEPVEPVQKSCIPIKASLYLEKFYSNNKPGITLIWDVVKLNDSSSFKRYNSSGLEYRSFIKEYQIYGYKGDMSKTHGEELPWQLIGKIENVLPPAKCTLTDLHKGHTYNFSVRITDDEDCMSDFSEPVTAIL